jgi:hypothetical protein
MRQIYGVALESCNWERDWGGVLQLIFECREDLDQRALSPVAVVF